MFLVPIQYHLYDRRGCGSYLKRRLLLVWLIKRISWLYIFLLLIAVSLCTGRRSNEEFILMSHRSHRFTQISSLQATVVTMPHSNRYFSARELRIFFRNTNCTNYTNKLLSLERFVFNTQYYSFKSHTDLTDLTDFFRCKQRFVYHQDCVSTILLHMVHNY